MSDTHSTSSAARLRQKWTTLPSKCGRCGRYGVCLCACYAMPGTEVVHGLPADGTGLCENERAAHSMVNCCLLLARSRLQTWRVVLTRSGMLCAMRGADMACCAHRPSIHPFGSPPSSGPEKKVAHADQTRAAHNEPQQEPVPSYLDSFELKCALPPFCLGPPLLPALPLCDARH